MRDGYTVFDCDMDVPVPWDLWLHYIDDTFKAWLCTAYEKISQQHEHEFPGKAGG